MGRRTDGPAQPPARLGQPGGHVGVGFRVGGEGGYQVSWQSPVRVGDNLAAMLVWAECGVGELGWKCLWRGADRALPCLGGGRCCVGQACLLTTLLP